MSSPALQVPEASVGVTPAPPATAGPGGQRLRQLIERREAAIFLVAVVLFIYFAIKSSAFISYANFVTMTQFLAPIAVIGCGEVLLLTCGEVDLSLGTVFIAFPFMTYFLWANHGFSIGLATAVGVVGAAIFGLVNGLITTMFSVPSFVTTLGTLFALDGAMLLLSNGTQETMTLTGTGGNILGNWSWAEILWATAAVLLLYVVLHRTRLGNHITATGGNLLGAAEAGVPTRRVKIWCFMLAAALAATDRGYRLGADHDAGPWQRRDPHHVLWHLGGRDRGYFAFWRAGDGDRGCARCHRARLPLRRPQYHGRQRLYLPARARDRHPGCHDRQRPAPPGGHEPLRPQGDVMSRATL